MYHRQWKEFWESNEEKEWKEKEKLYFEMVDESNRCLENKFDTFNVDVIWEWSAKSFYNFLHDEFFVWKYTAKNRLSTTRKKLKEVSKSELSFLLKVLKMFNDELKEMNGYDSNMIKIGLEFVTMIPGLGMAGASGLLSIMFPNYYGTVDQFVVKSLEEASIETNVKNPQSIQLNEAIFLEKIMYEKAGELNRQNNSDYWTSRKIDKVLWAHRESSKSIR